MVKSEKCFATLGAALILAFASAAGADTARDYRAASATAIRVASAHSQAGDAAQACAALSQSLESYRKALAQETGDTEAAASSIFDDSDGMAEVRAKFGCKR